MTQVQTVALEDSPFYVKAARYDEFVHEYVAYDANGQAHWGGRAWDAECAAIDANRTIREHAAHNPEEVDWLDEASMYSDSREGYDG